MIRVDLGPLGVQSVEFYQNPYAEDVKKPLCGWGVTIDAIKSRLPVKEIAPGADCIEQLASKRRLYVPISKFIMAAFEQQWIDRPDVLRAYVNCIVELAKLKQNCKITQATIDEFKMRLLEQIDTGHL